MKWKWKGDRKKRRKGNGIKERCTDKKENKIFLIYEEMLKYFPIYEEAVSQI
jgi:hypothetical protein